MKDSVYIVSDAWGVQKMTRREPVLSRGEVAVRVTITVPDNCFKNPIINAALDVPEDRVIEPRAEVEALEIPSEGPGQ